LKDSLASYFCAATFSIPPRAYELDVVFWNDPRRSELHFLDAIVIVECKATTNPVGSGDLRWFISKLGDRGAHNGILVALNGITGSTEKNSSAHSEILSAVMRDKIKLLVLTRSEIIRLKSPGDLVYLLTQKFLRLTLDRAVYFDAK
jgi:hypothetical protein